MKKSFPDGSKHVGELVWLWTKLRGKKHGQGTLTSPDGRKQEWEFRNGKPVDK